MTAPSFVPLLTVLMALLNSAPAARAGAGLDLARQLNQTFAEVAEKVSPAIVVITVKEKPPVWSADTDAGGGDATPDSSSREFWRRFHQQFPNALPPEGQGSGAIIRNDGFILTSHHVVENAEQIKVRLKDGRTFNASLRGADPQSDLAVIRIEADHLPVARLGDSSKIRVGEFAIAIGAPYSYDYSVTIGHVSAKSRSNVVPVYEGGAMMDQDFIQTDAHINPGNSGGPLLNIDGEVIGIITMIRGLSTGIGFAIPSNLAKEISDKLVADGKFTRLWLGIEIRAVKDDSGQDDPEFRAAIKGVASGVVVRAIRPDGPAAKSELRRGNVITAVDGKPVETPQQLRNEVRGKTAGHVVTLNVFRGGKTVPVKVKPGEYVAPSVPAVAVRIKPGEPTLSGLGMTIQGLTRELADKFGAKLTNGVIVVLVDRDGPADRKGIKSGDIITAIDQDKVASPKQFFEALKKADLKKGVVVKVLTADSVHYEVLKEGDD